MAVKHLNLYTNSGFQRVFANESSCHIIIDLLNALLPGNSEINEIIFNDVDQERVLPYRKDIFDIICLNGAGEKIIVEIQKNHTNFFPKRAEYIADFPILEKGKNETYFNQFEKIYCLGDTEFQFHRFRR